MAMAETNEAETLEVAFFAARQQVLRGPPSTSEETVMRAAVLAVAAKARELDAARGGTLTAEELTALLGGEVNTVRDHLAAQGRTIAGLEKWLHTRRCAFCEWREYVVATLEEHGVAMRAHIATCEKHPLRDARATIAEKDARIAELEKQFDGARKELIRHIKRNAAYVRRLQAARDIAESALATLRQAVEPLVREIRAYEPDTTSTLFFARDSEPGPEVLDRNGVDALLAAFYATPAEHPDTATLRAIRERGGEVEDLGMAASGYKRADWLTLSERDRVEYREQGRRVARYLLGDSGPSGGGEKDHEEWCSCSKCRNGDYHHDEAATPTTPPDVAASGPQPEDFAVRPGESYAQTGERVLAMLAREEAQSAPTTTPEEDWRTVEGRLQHATWCKFVRHAGECSCSAARALAALDRLKAEPRRAAERMRERCAAACEMNASHLLTDEWASERRALERMAATLRHLPLE